MLDLHKIKERTSSNNNKQLTNDNDDNDGNDGNDDKEKD